MKRVNKSASPNLREKAEELLKMKTAATASTQSETDMLKLIHELDLHQIELELQNEELLSAKNKVEVTVRNYTELFNFTPACYYKLSKEGDIIDLNLSGAHMLGNEPYHLKESRFGFFVSDDTKPIFNLFLNKIFSSRTKQSCEVTLLKQDNLTMYGYLIGLVNKNGNQCNINMIDITERKQAEENLKKILTELTIANKEILFQNEERKKREEELVIINKELEHLVQLNNEKNSFISILGHDLRNHFTGLLGSTELLQENILLYNTAEIEDFVNLIYQSAHNAYNLLEDILMWAKTQSNKTTFNPQKMSFADLCNNTIKILSLNANAKNIKINLDKGTDIKLVADIDMLKTILRNLIYNAIKYTNRNGSINIKAEENPKNVTISVSDNGIGIAPENLTKLFDISKIITTTGTAEETGTGLGLLLCKEFVAKHGGRIWVESEPGKGSVFSFTIPYKSETIERNVVLDSGEGDRNNYLKILIADDNESIRMILGDMVKKYSHNILYAKSGDEAVDVFRNNPDIDLILMDFYMPGLDGYEATRIIRQINKKVIIIVETADTFSKVTEEFAGVVINDYFPKPFSKFYLDQLITKHFNRMNLTKSQEINL
jgi:signal transduction histidine kinase/CheY-like chemotaxis protein